MDDRTQLRVLARLHAAERAELERAVRVAAEARRRSDLVLEIMTASAAMTPGRGAGGHTASRNGSASLGARIGVPAAPGAAEGVAAAEAGIGPPSAAATPAQQLAAALARMFGAPV